MTPSLARVLTAIDAANACDPRLVEVDERPMPAELVYGWRMSNALARLAPEASEPLQIAARGHHIERWTSPRGSYPAGRAGYLQWRRTLKEFHATRLAQIMAELGVAEAVISRVRFLVRKERLTSDAETQMLEDAACIVFLTHDAGAFLEKVDENKLSGILAKTWSKMSPLARAHALKLPMAPLVARILEERSAG